MRSLLFMSCILSACTAAHVSRQAIAHNAAASQSLARGDLDEAEAGYRLALEYNANFAEPRGGLGAVALRRSHLAEAEEHLRGAIRIDEDFALAWSNLGVVLERTNRGREARKAYERALEIDPGVVPARINLARLLIADGDLGAARSHLLRLRLVAPENADVIATLAYCEFLLDRPEAARRLATDAARIAAKPLPQRRTTSESLVTTESGILPAAR